MKQKTFFNLLYNIVAALFIGVAAAVFFPVDPLVVAAALFFGTQGFLLIIRLVYKFFQVEYQRNVGLAMAVQTEVWENMIAENLFKDYAWVKRAKDRTAFVINNAVVHIPQAGTRPAASKNRESYPLPIVKRNDTDITYAIDEISTEATYIPDADKVELSYDKASSVLKDHFGVLGESSAREILSRWYPSLASKQVLTTGTATAAYLTSATGNRKKYMVADVATAKTTLITDTKKESGNRILIMTEGAYNQLKADPVVTNKDTMDSVGAVWSNGDLTKIHGFDIIRTDVTGRYDNSGTPVLKTYVEGAATSVNFAASDNDVMLLVDLNFVHFALGEVKVFEDLASATMQGDVYSALVRLGGRKERNDEVGVVAIIAAP